MKILGNQKKNLDCQDLIQQYEEQRLKDEAANTSKSDKSNKKEATSSSGRSSSASNKRKSEDKVGNKKKRRDSMPSETDNDSVSDISSRPPEQNGFDRGLEAEKILGASDSNGLTFLIQFKGVDQAEMVPANVANVKIPQMVIKFYEERLSWYSDNEE